MSQDPVARSDRLDAELNDNPVVTNLVTLAQQHTKIIRYLRICVIVIIVLMAGLGWAVWRAQSAATAASDASSQVRVTCLASNEARASQRQLWTFILTSFPPPLDETSQQRQQRVEQTVKFKRYVKKKFAPLDCSFAALQKRGDQVSLPQPTPAPTPNNSASMSTSGQSSSGATTPANSSPPSQRRMSHSSSPTPRSTPNTSPSASPSATNSPTPKPTPSPLCVPVVHKCLVADSISWLDLVVLWVWRWGWHG